MANLKAQEKSRLAYEFGHLVSPFEDLVNYSVPPPVGDYRVAVAKVQAGLPAFEESLLGFSTFANDVVFIAESLKIRVLLRQHLISITDDLINARLDDDLSELQSLYEDLFGQFRSSFFELLDQFPIEWEPEIFAANTPFTAYIRVKEAVSSARKRMHYFDSYLKPEFFQQFLADLSRSIEIRLITTPGNKGYGVKSIEYVSNVFAVEFSDYQLIEVAPKTIHDRNLRIDDIIFSLGPGIDRAGFALTNFGPTDSSNKAHQEFDEIMKNGTVVHRS